MPFPCHRFTPIRSGLFRKRADSARICVRILAATGKPSQLKFYVRAGLVNGLEPDEIRECLLHVMGYCGFPTGLDACVKYLIHGLFI